MHISSCKDSCPPEAEAFTGMTGWASKELTLTLNSYRKVLVLARVLRFV